MANPMIKIHDTETGEIVEREMTALELAEWQAQEVEHLTEIVPGNE